MDTLLQDIRYSFRMMLKNWGFSLVVLLTLAIGIGANTIIFSVVYRLLVRSLPYGDPQSIVTVWQDYTRKTGRAREWTSPDTYRFWRDENHVFDGISVIDGWLPTLQAGEPEQITGAQATDNIFSVLGVAPALGRTFTADEGKANGPRVVILSDGLWKRRFGADRSIIGKDILISEEKYTVIGIMPADFEFPLEPAVQMWTPLQLGGADECGDCITLRAIARLKAGTTVARATSEMILLTRRLEQQFPDEYKDVGITIVPLQILLTEEVKPAILVLFAAVGVVLMIACANVANLLLVRAARRKTEMAIRSTLGAASSRLMRQLLTENLLLTLTGGALGVLLASAGLDALVALLPQDLLLISARRISIETPALMFSLAISVATGVIFGLVPMLQFQALNETLKEGGRSRSNAAARNIRSAFVITQVAFALMLLISAGLLLKSFLRVIHVNPGFKPENVLTLQLNLPELRYPEREQVSTFYNSLIERITALPGVIAAGTTSSLPMADNYTDTHYMIEGQSLEKMKDQPVWYQQVSNEYLQAMGIALLKGRHFGKSDNLKSPRVVIVTQSFAQRHFPGADAVGKRVNLNNPQNPVWREIIGVAADVKQFGFTQETPIAMYLPHGQSPARFAALAIRASSDPSKLADEIRTLVWSLDEHLAVSNVRTLDQVLSNTVAIPRMTVYLTGAFAGAAILLAALGLYGVVSYTTAQRTNEIGIRIAIGAANRDVLKMVILQGMALMVAGVGLGLLGAFLLTRLLSSMLFGVSAIDPLTFLVAPMALVSIALMATWIPARRAAQIDPAIALRYE
jgi:putative ABC transport system permease protein